MKADGAVKSASSADDSITVSDIVQFFYCPRKVYFLKTLGVPIIARHKMEYGEEVHELEKRRMLERKQIYGFDRDDVAEVLEGLQIEAPEIGLRGKVDVALKLKSGEVIPVDTKYTDEISIQSQYRKQLCAYALLLEQHFKAQVRRGVIYFSLQKEPKVITILREDKEAVLRDIDHIRDLISKEIVPRGVSPEKCEYCEVRKYCV